MSDNQMMIARKSKLSVWLQQQMNWERWTIASWPPLASHLCFLLLGAASANLFLPSATAGPRLSKQKLFMSLSTEERLWIERPQIGDRLLAVKSSPGKKDCRLQNAAFTVHGTDAALVLSLDLREAAALPLVITAEREHRLQFMNEKVAGGLGLCQTQRTVRYGSRS